MGINSILILLLISSSVFSANASEDEVEIKNHHEGNWPVMLFALAATNWMIHEAGREPENARYFYMVAMLSSINNIEKPFGKSMFAASTAMTVTNQYHVNISPAPSINSRQDNLKMFWGSTILVLGAELAFKGKPDELKFSPTTSEGIGLQVSYDF
ncbi:hypothetical protein RI844_18100 [Thalassotalea fonticola]|uniref:Uncharacterized protein n=1 Tax=Thalassotalea fonticola TaxID=3065649 RepID=A0ABZ0GPD0_9GAMM|nr:hypothetical protein RI844_18100 [Colwelliaceae bacterium S1-1]